MYEDDSPKVMAGESLARHIPLIEKLEKERDRIQEKLNDYNAAIDALKANPAFENMVNVLSKVTRI